MAWAMKKYKRLQRHKTETGRLLQNLAEAKPYLFVHWQNGMVGTFA
jgi:hypothetical protein